MISRNTTQVVKFTKTGSIVLKFEFSIYEFFFVFMANITIH